MNTKWLLLLILMLNIFTYVYGSQACSSFNSDSLGTQAIDYFYDSGPLKLSYTQCRTNLANGVTGTNASGNIPTGGILNFASSVNGSNSTFISNAQSATTASSGSVGSFVGGGLAFLDLIKLVIGLAGLLVGLPVISILSALGVNFFFAAIFIIAVDTMFVIGVIEFLRGSSF